MLHTCTRSERASSLHLTDNLGVEGPHLQCKKAASSKPKILASVSIPSIWTKKIKIKTTTSTPFPKEERKAPSVHNLILTLHSLEGIVLQAFLFWKLSTHAWNFFPINAPSSQEHSAYGSPIHLHRYSGSPELVLWAVATYQKIIKVVKISLDQVDQKFQKQQTYRECLKVVVISQFLLLIKWEKKKMNNRS